MCEFCNIEKGDTEVLISKEVEVSIGTKQLASHTLEMYVGHTDHNELIMLSAYYTDDEDPVAEILLPMNYCPMCGRKIHND